MERNEKEHKELLKKANDGIDAIVKLQDKYADVTKISIGGGEFYPLTNGKLVAVPIVIEEE